MAYIMKLNGGYLKDEDHVGPVVAWQDCKYIKPINFPDRIRIEVAQKIVEDDRIRISLHMYSMSQNRLVAISNQEIVSYDFKRKMKVGLPLKWIDG